jgi:hypothetical protein
MKEHEPMTSTPKTYTTDSEVAALVAELLAAGNELRIAVGDEAYTLKLDVAGADRPSAEDVERSIAGIEQAAGSWKDEDTDAFLEYVYQRRSMPPRRAVKL